MVSSLEYPCDGQNMPVIDCIRPSAPEDVEQIVAINNATWPGYPTTVAEMRDADQYHDRHSHAGRWVAEKCGHIVAVAQYDQLDPRMQPQTYWVEINVHPDHQRQGIGGALYLRVMEELKAFDPVLIRAVVGEERTDALRFFRARGFEELWRTSQAHLDVLSFDADAYPAPSGTALVPAASLLNDPDRDVKLYNLHSRTRQDALLPMPVIISQEQYAETVLYGTELDRDGFFVAIAPDGDYVGLVILDASEAEHRVALEWLGVRRDMRGQGIGAALLAQAISFAKTHGAQSFVVNLNSANAALSRLCDRLGFARSSALVHLVNTVK